MKEYFFYGLITGLLSTMIDELLWQITHEREAKKVKFNCEECNDWSCQYKWCEKYRKEKENGRN